MKVQEIKEIAQRMSIPVGKMKKTELIRTIQRTEGNNECFETGIAKVCGQEHCLWREDCQ
ncbi:SAP domain-containing protein [Geomonas sp. Red32]|uniref:SAP domain-containing protein n=1 Tax=Geomonas sp. Red32 TaxID=2912856 RepID=UPI00202CE029|nr:SAP domain-containing protein [Geomonas sp. Red32]MCM0080760.1 SAP domain-containing protein [Geomonas sp. Red32]